MLAIADATLALAPGPPALAVLLAVAGLCIAPAFAILHGLVTRVARTSAWRLKVGGSPGQPRLRSRATSASVTAMASRRS